METGIVTVVVKTRVKVVVTKEVISFVEACNAYIVFVLVIFEVIVVLGTVTRQEHALEINEFGI